MSAEISSIKEAARLEKQKKTRANRIECFKIMEKEQERERIAHQMRLLEQKYKSL